MKKKKITQPESIPEHKFAKEVIQRVEQIQNIILESMSELVVYQDTEGRVLWANRAAAESVNLSPEKLSGKHCYEIWHQRKILCENCPVQKAIQTGEPQEKEVISPDGRFWFIRGYPVKNIKDKVVSAIEVTSEISDRKLAEIRMWEKTEDLTLIDSLNNAINQGASLPEIIQLLAKETGRVFSSSGVTIYLLSEDKKYLLLQNINIPPILRKQIEKLAGTKIPSLIKIPLKEDGLYAKILFGRKPQITDDPATIQGLMAEHTENKLLRKIIPLISKILNIHSVISVPLIAGSEIIGLLDISRKEPFTKDDLQRLTILSAKITTVIKHKQTEESLVKEKDQAQKYLEIAGVIMVAIGVDHKVTLVNKKGCEVLGYEKDEIIGKDWFKNFIPEMIRNEVAAVFEKLIAGKIEPVEYFENPILTKSGKEKIISWHNTILKDKNGRITGTLSSGEDITEYKHAEVILRRHETGMLEAQRIAKLGNWELDTATGAFTWSAEIFHLAGFDPSGETPNFSEFLECAHPEDRQIVESAMHAAEKGKFVSAEFRSNPAWGTRRSFLAHLEPVHDAEGRVVRLVGTLQDITERKRAEEVLRESEEKYRLLFENANDAIYLHEVSREGRRKIFAANEAACRMLGYTREELLRMTIDDIDVPEQKEKIPAILDRLFSEGFAVFETEHLRKDGSRIQVLVSIRTFNLQGTMVMLSIVRDITERKQSEELHKK